MAMDNVKVNFGLNINLEGDDARTATLDLGRAIDKVDLARGQRFTDGSATGQCDVFFHDILSITTADEIDLNGVVLKDAFGTGLAITKLKCLYIMNLTGGELTIGAAANPLPIFGTPATHTLLLPDDGEWMMIWPGAGLTIGASTGELEFAHGEGAAKDVEMIVAGVR